MKAAQDQVSDQLRTRTQIISCSSGWQLRRTQVQVQDQLLGTRILPSLKKERVRADTQQPTQFSTEQLWMVGQRICSELESTGSFCSLTGLNWKELV